jgi:succinyl-CoA synthetase beta subunit
VDEEKGNFKEDSAGDEGGVRLCNSASEAAKEAHKMLGCTLVTHQTGPKGKQVNRIYIEDGSLIDKRTLSCPFGRSQLKSANICMFKKWWYGY